MVQPQEHRGEAIALVAGASEAVGTCGLAVKVKATGRMTGLQVVETVVPTFPTSLDVVDTNRFRDKAGPMVDRFLTVHDPVPFSTEFAEALGSKTGEYEVRGVVLDVGGEPEGAGVELVKERIAAKIAVGIAVAEHEQGGGIGDMGEVAHHRLGEGEARATREVGGVSLAEQVRVGAVTHGLAPPSTEAVGLVKVMVALERNLVTGTWIDPLIKPIVGFGERRASLVGLRQEG